MKMAELSLNVNQEVYKVVVEEHSPLLWVLRDNLGLTGTKYSCGMGL
jgi:isoquinoline 1-oxidoreductase alpha subunit